MPCKDVFIKDMTTELGDYCCPDRLRDEISKNSKSLQIIDCRSQSEFTRSHVRGAINITLPSLMLKRLKRGNLNICSVIQNNEAKERFSRYSKTATIVLYDECSTELHANPASVINLLVKKLRQDGCRASFLLGEYSLFVCPSVHHSDLCLHASLSFSLAIHSSPLLGSGCLSVLSSVNAFILLSINKSIHQSIHPSIHQSFHFHPSIHLSILPSFNPSINPSILQSNHPTIHQFIPPSNHQSFHAVI